MSAEQIQFVTLEELEAMGWRPGRHTSSVGPTGAGKTFLTLDELPWALKKYDFPRVCADPTRVPYSGVVGPPGTD